MKYYKGEYEFDGILPVRRYAIFNDILRGDYAIVVRGDDMGRAEKWGGFVTWLGAVKPAQFAFKTRTLIKNMGMIVAEQSTNVY